MEIFITLREVLDKCNDWQKFCSDKGYSEWVVNEGGGNILVSLSEEDARKYGLID